MPRLLIGTADVCVLVVATHWSTVIHLDAVLGRWWRPTAPPRSALLVDVRLDPDHQAETARAVAEHGPDVRETAGMVVHIARTPQATTLVYPTLGACVHVRTGEEPTAEIVGTDPLGLAVVTALTTRDLVRHALERKGWRLFHSATMPLDGASDVPTRAWTLIRPADSEDILAFLPHPSDTDLGLAFPTLPPDPDHGEPQVIVAAFETHLLTVLPNAPTAPAPQWLAVPGAFPRNRDEGDPVRGFLRDVFALNPVFEPAPHDPFA